VAGPRLDEREIEALFRRYGPLVRRRARSILGNEHEADEALQEVFVRVLAAGADFRGESLPSTWLYRITTNLCLNRLRDQRRHRERLEREADAEQVSMAADAAAPREASADRRAVLRQVLARVPEDLAQIAVHYHVDEMDQEEIAAVLGVSRRTVGYRLERFREEALRVLGAASHAAEPVAAGAPGRGPKPRGP
jgi:RNA polymerase sigma-70 factor (ECF subfamily)